MALVRLLSTLVVFFAVGLQYASHNGAGHPEFLENIVHGARLCRFYGAHAPEKIESIPSIMEKYAGKERQLYGNLAKKYGVPNDVATTWRVDALSVLRASLELSLAAASRRSEAAGAYIAAWRSQPMATKLFRALAAAVGIAHLAAPGDARSRLRNLVVFGPLAVAAVAGPSPDSFSLRSVGGALAALVSSLDARGRAALVGVATLGYSTFRPPPRAPIVVVGLLVAAALTNPAFEAGAAGDATAETLFDAGLVTSRRVAQRAIANAPGQFKVRDFVFLSVISCATTDTWTAPVVALGAGSIWTPLGAVSASGDNIQVEAPIAPLYLVPAGLAAAAWFALKLFDAPPGRVFVAL